MNKSTPDGKLKEVKGSVKEALGKVIGNDGLVAEGANEKAEGRTQKHIEEAARSGKAAAKTRGS